MEGLGDPLIHVDQHALLLADGVVALLDALADPVQERRPDDGGPDIAYPRFRDFEQFFARWNKGQDVRELLKEAVDDLQAEVLVGWYMDLLDGVQRDICKRVSRPAVRHSL